MYPARFILSSLAVCDCLANDDVQMPHFCSRLCAIFLFRSKLASSDRDDGGRVGYVTCLRGPLHVGCDLWNVHVLGWHCGLHVGTHIGIHAQVFHADTRLCLLPATINVLKLGLSPQERVPM